MREMRRRCRNVILGSNPKVPGEFVKDILNQGATLVVLGTGGVGKTTIAAALAMGAAMDTGVLTVDPARRLRDALGIERLSSRPLRLEARRLRAAGLDPALKLSAMVLDVKRTWDGLVERFVQTPEARHRSAALPADALANTPPLN
jgi:anion-transporting  ArsA/GET3 family ATPase